MLNIRPKGWNVGFEERRPDRANSVSARWRVSCTHLKQPPMRRPPKSSLCGRCRANAGCARCASNRGPSMRPWMIVWLSMACAILVATALAGPEVLGAARTSSWTALLPSLSMLAVAALAVYALCAMLLATGALLTETLLARHRLGRAGEYRTLTACDWIAALGTNGLHRLISRPATEPIPGAEADSMIQLPGRFDPVMARREIARLHYIGLARAHFFSALIVLTALVGLGIAQDHEGARLALVTIPTTSTTLILIGLILLAILSRIAVDVAVEPLIEAISELPAEGVEIGLLRRAVEILESAAVAVGSRGPLAFLPLHDRLDAVIEENQRTLLDAVRHLSASTDALGATMRSSATALGEAISLSQAQLALPADGGNADTYKFAELQGAVEDLTAVLQRLTTIPGTAEGAPLGADVPGR